MRLDTGHTNNENDELPPVRAAIKSCEVIDNKAIKSNSKRIASSDYNQWEKYDAGIDIYVFPSSHFTTS